MRGYFFYYISEGDDASLFEDVHAAEYLEVQLAFGLNV